MAPKTKSTNHKSSIINPEDALEGIHESIASIFEQVQLSVANHRKNCVALWKVYANMCEVVDVRRGQSSRKGGGDARVKYVGEQKFGEVFLDMVRRVLGMKKGAGAAGAERVVRFVGGFVRFVTEKASEGNDNGDDEEENSATRLAARLLNWLVQGFQAKDKIVRLRCVQLVGELITHLGAIDEDTFTNIRTSLLDRLNDKEPGIRALVVAALAKLVGSEDPDPDPNEKSIMSHLLDVLETDPAAEPRRSALLHISPTPQTLPFLLRRARDVDSVTRKLVYTSLLSSAKISNPRLLSIAQRELVVRDGLGDREPSVRVAAGKVVCAWFDFVSSEKEEGNDGWEGDDAGVMKSLVNFLSLFDVLGRGGPGEGEAIAIDAVLSIFTTRREVLDCFLFDDTYFVHPSPESSLLARIFVEHCSNFGQGLEAKLENAKLPVVSAFAYYMQGGFEALFREMDGGHGGARDGGEDEEEEDELAKQEAVIGNLLRLILCLDYTDEIGRRKVFGVVKETLFHPALPPSLIDPCVDVLKSVMVPSGADGDNAKEETLRDFVRVVVEGVVELREGTGVDEEEGKESDELEDDSDPEEVGPTTKKGGTKDEPRSISASSRTQTKGNPAVVEQVQVDMVDLRCLFIVIAMLERVNGTFESNSTLQGVLTMLIVPCIKRKTNLPILREKAMMALGLCCLIVREEGEVSGAQNLNLSRGMVGGSLGLFLSQIRAVRENEGEEEGKRVNEGIKLVCLSVVFDLLVCCLDGGRVDDRANQIIEFLLQTLEAEESEEAQAVIVIGFCKLLLTGVVKDSRVLLCLLIMYISPLTKANQRVRQCLAYFFPVYSFASVENQGRVGEIFMKALDIAFRMYAEFKDENEEDESRDGERTMIDPEKVGMVILEWLDFERVYETTSNIKTFQALSSPKLNPQANLVVDILLALYDEERSDEERKVLLRILSGLKLKGHSIDHGQVDLKIVKKIDILLGYLDEQCPLENSTHERLFEKFRKRVEAEFEEELEEIRNKDEAEDDEEVKEVYRKIGVYVPGEQEDGGRRTGPRARARVRAKRAQSEEEKEKSDQEQVDTDVPSESDAPSTAADEEEEDSRTPRKPPTPAPRRARRSRKPSVHRDSDVDSTAKASTAADDDEEDNSTPRKSPTPAPRRARRSRKPSVHEDSDVDSTAKASTAADDDEEDNSTPRKSPTPAPRRSRRSRKPSVHRDSEVDRTAKAKAKGKSRQSIEESDEDNIPPSPILLPPSPSHSGIITATPRKKGVKRILTPGSGMVNSPKDRKRKKLKGSLKPLKMKKESTPIEQDMPDTNSELEEEEEESLTTPTKSSGRPAWRGRGRRAKQLGEGVRRAGLRTRAGKRGKEPDEDEDEAEEVASIIASETSDDLGGY